MEKQEPQEEFDFKQCPQVEDVGAYAVYVSAGCRHLHMIKGRLVTTKRECRKCGKRKEKENG